IPRLGDCVAPHKKSPVTLRQPATPWNTSKNPSLSYQYSMRSGPPCATASAAAAAGRSRRGTMRSMRPVALALAALATFAFIATEADARVGGGRSSGSRGTQTYSAPPTTRTAPNTGAPMERSMTRPGQPGAVGRQAAPATQPGGFFNRPGLLGGLAAGFLGAGLFGLLFGHGLFGGLGGLA